MEFMSDMSRVSWRSTFRWSSRGRGRAAGGCASGSIALIGMHIERRFSGACTASSRPRVDCLVLCWSCKLSRRRKPVCYRMTFSRRTRSRWWIRAPRTLDDAVEACDETSTRCALADGADLLTLQDNEAESRWERAVFLHGASGERQRKFVRTLADYLATPIPTESRPEILLKKIMEEGHAELLYQMTVPGGPLALTDARAEVCRAQLATLRSGRKRDEATNGIGDVGEWEKALNHRRELLEIDMTIEALDRSIQMLRFQKAECGRDSTAKK
jgi:hypothetical protein